MALIFSETQTKKLIDMPEAIQAVEKVFIDRAAGKVKNVARQRLRGSSKQLNTMSAWHEEWDLICLRAYASGANTISIYNGSTGKLVAIINARYLSSLRTGAASGVASKYLSPADTDILGIVGTGRQAIFQLEAIVPLCGVKQVLVFGRNPEKLKNFVRKMKNLLSVEFKECPFIDEIEERSDILVMATKSHTSVIQGGKLKTQVLIISIGANQRVKHEVSGEIIRQMDLIVTDDLPSARIDSGDLVAACKAGLIRWDDVVPLERVVAGGRPADRPKHILFQSNGIAAEDLAVGRHVLERAEIKKVKGKNVFEI